MTTTEQTTSSNPDEYNGWTNRETWATALHLSNDEMLYRTCVAIVARADEEVAVFYDSNDFEMPPIADTNLAAERIEQFVTDHVEEFLHNGVEIEWARMMIVDVGSFWRVDWRAVADAARLP